MQHMTMMAKLIKEGFTMEEMSHLHYDTDEVFWEKLRTSNPDKKE